MKRQRDTAVEERDRLQAENGVLALKLAEAKAEVERRKLERARPGIVRPFRLGAFATGSYTCKCLSCGEQFTGDKRAVSCLPCAAEAAEHARDEAVAEIERLNGALIAEQEHTDRLQSENATMAIKMAGLTAKINGIRWSVCESEVLRDPHLSAAAQRIFTEIVGLRLDDSGRAALKETDDA